MYRQEASEENVTRNVHRQLPESLLVDYANYKICDSSHFISYRQALKWIKEKQLCLRRFIDILKLYPSFIQENAYDPLWNFIQPLLPTTTVERISSLIPDSNLTPSFSPTTTSVAHVNLLRDQSSVTTFTDLTINCASEVSLNASPSRKKENFLPRTPVSPSRVNLLRDQSSVTTFTDYTINCTSEALLNTSPSRKKENFLPRSPASQSQFNLLRDQSRSPGLNQQSNSNQSLFLHGKGIVNIPSISVTAEASMKGSPNYESSPDLYSRKVFLCKDPADIEDSMSMAVLSSLSSVSFVHCLPPTMQPVKNIIPECNTFIFIMNNFTVSASDCLSQLKQAQSLHLPIQFIRYHDFQLPPNLEEIVKISLASATGLDQYLSIRRRSFDTSSTVSVRGSHCSSDREASPDRFRCSSDREASPDRCRSPLLYRQQQKNLLLPLPSSRNGNSENGYSNTSANVISMIVSCLKDGYEKSLLYDSKCHLACVSQIIDSVSELLESPLSYNTAYFQVRKKRLSNSATHSLCSKPTVTKAWFSSSNETRLSRQTSSHNSPIKKQKQSPKTPINSRRNHNDNDNLILVIPTHRSESKTINSYRRQRQVPFDNVKPEISPDSSDCHSPTNANGITRIKKHYEDNDHEDDDGDDEEEEDEENGLEFPPLQDNSLDKCLLMEEKETSYVVYPDCDSGYNKKPTVIKWPVPWNNLEKVERNDSLRDETDSTSTNFFEVDLTKNLYSSSDED